MNSETSPENQTEEHDMISAEHFAEEYESVGDYHRRAAHHFAAAAKHHMKAADADDDGDEESLAIHAFKAYRHQLEGVQYAEIAVMEADLQGDEIDADEAMAMREVATV
jgi:hypothetical protein